MNICLLDNSKTPYNHNSLDNENIRGAERSLINLALKLNKLGHKITILNNNVEKINYENIRYININSYNEKINYDLAVSNNDINNFNYVKAKKKIAISHSIQTIEKFIRKRQLFAYLRHKPKIFLLGQYHKNKRNILTRVFGSEIINWAVDDDCINAKIKNKIDKDKALFTSYPDRNLNKLISTWINYIHVKNKQIKLYTTPTNNNFSKYNIFNRKLVNRKIFIEEMLNTRVFLIPGHVAELYCITAEEAKELCIPIVTFGIGALSERVEHGKTGFIAKNEKEFAHYTIELFTNNSRWNELRSNLINMRNSNNWDIATNNFLNKCNN